MVRIFAMAVAGHVNIFMLAAIHNTHDVVTDMLQKE